MQRNGDNYQGGFDRDKNPLGLDVEDIVKLTEERNVRLMSFRIGLDDEAESKALALSGAEEVRGRFRAIEPDSTAYRNALLTALQEEWKLLTKRNQAIGRGISRLQAQRDPAIFARKGIDVDKYEMPIIIANLPPGSAGSGAPEFVQGWVPKRIKRKLAVGEYLFMSKFSLNTLINVIAEIANKAEEGEADGSETFIAGLRTSLATQLKVRPDDLFRRNPALQDYRPIILHRGDQRLEADRLPAPEQDPRREDDGVARARPATT